MQTAYQVTRTIILQAIVFVDNEDEAEWLSRDMNDDEMEEYARDTEVELAEGLDSE